MALRTTRSRWPEGFLRGDDRRLSARHGPSHRAYPFYRTPHVPDLRFASLKERKSSGAALNDICRAVSAEAGEKALAAFEDGE